MNAQDPESAQMFMWNNLLVLSTVDVENSDVRAWGVVVLVMPEFDREVTARFEFSISSILNM